MIFSATIVRQLSPYLLMLGLGFLLFPSGGRDDVHITYWAAYTLSHFGEIVNYNGEYVEQSSSLLHTLILAALNAVTGIDMVDLGTGVSVAFGLFSVYLVGVLAPFLRQDAITARLLLATSVPLLYWSFGALEAAIVAAVVLLMLITLIRLYRTPSVGSFLVVSGVIAMYLMLRPEAFFVTALFLVVCAAGMYGRTQGFRVTLGLLAVTGITFAALVLWRTLYFDAYFPQPVEAKIGASILHKIPSGLSYLVTAFREYFLFYLMIIPVLVYSTMRLKAILTDPELLVLAGFIATYLLFIVTAGGDWMEGARFFVPVVGPLIVLALIYYSRFIEGRKILVAGLLLNLVALVVFAAKYSTGTPLIYYPRYAQSVTAPEKFSFFEIANRVHYRDIPFSIEMEHLLRKMDHAGVAPVIMSVQAGMVPYRLFREFYGKARFIDAVGLSSRDVTECLLTKDLPKRRTGINFEYAFLLRHADELQERCNIPLPDIVYDRDSETFEYAEMFREHGYMIVYVQKGEVCHQGLLQGRARNARQFIAVKNDLAQRLGLTPVVRKFECL